MRADRDDALESVITLDAEAYADFVDAVENPAAPTAALIALMRGDDQ